MPGAIEYIPPTNGKLRNDFNSLVVQERAKRRKAYTDALRYYFGKHDKQLTTEFGEPDDNIVINLVKMSADRTVSFLFPDMPRFEIDPTTPEETPEEMWLRRFFEVNGGLAKFTKMALRGYLSGHVFVRVKPESPYPRLVVLDPTAVTVYWRIDDITEVLWYELRYLVGKDVYIDDFVKINDNLWRIYTYKQTTPNNVVESILLNNSLAPLDNLDFAGNIFELVGRSKNWSFSIPPIIDWGHLPSPDDYYGVGEFNQKELQDTINRIASIRNQIIRENAEPVDYVTGADIDDIDGSGSLVTIASPNARVNRLEMRGDMPAISSVLDKLIETYLSVSRTVILKGDAKDLQRVTNASVRTLFLDALSKNSVLTDAYGRGLAMVAKLALQMAYSMGKLDTNPIDLPVTVKFGTPLPIDMAEVAAINNMALGKYMSAQTAATRLNLYWPFERQAMKNDLDND